MRSEIITQLDSDIDYWLYLRENPNWHKILSFHPERFKDFLEEYKIKRKKRFFKGIIFKFAGKIKNVKKLALKY